MGTKVFFRAGALAYLEELRDGIVLKLVRWMQGQCYGLIRRKVYNIKNDQRELMKVIQRNFKKVASMREWGWFIIIQKTKPLIGRVNLEEELRLLEEKAKDAYGSYKVQIDTKAQLELENVAMEDKALTSMNKLSLRLSKGDVLDPLVLCKRMMGAKFLSTCTGPAALLRFTSNLISSKISDTVVVGYDNKY